MLWNQPKHPLYKVKPVWKDTLWKDHPAWKTHCYIDENFLLPLEFMKTEPGRKDHLPGKKTHEEPQTVNLSHVCNMDISHNLYHADCMINSTQATISHKNLQEKCCLARHVWMLARSKRNHTEWRTNGQGSTLAFCVGDEVFFARLSISSDGSLGCWGRRWWGCREMNAM